LDVSETITAGDILTLVAATGDLADANTTETSALQGANGRIFGVAVLSPSTNAVSAATVDRNEGATSPGPDASGNWHSVNVALALPGQLFEGNIVAGANDETGVYIDNVHETYGVIESDAGYACIDQADTTNPVAFTMRYRSPQYDNVNDVWVYGPNAGVGILNPRAEFYFLVSATVFTIE
jgi:hypothetical protein